jgi:uncharacterized membrane protein
MQWSVSLLSVALTVALLYLVGAVTTNVVAKRAVQFTDRLLDRLPFVKTIYNASKKVMQTIAGGGGRPFRKVVLVPFPNHVTHSVGFVTHTSQDQNTGETLYTVFVATAPNPTTGFVMVMNAASVVEVGWSVEEAVKIVMSGGVLMPDSVPLAGAGSGRLRKQP